MKADPPPMPRHKRFYLAELTRLLKLRKAAGHDVLTHDDLERDKWLAHLAEQAGKEALADLARDFEWVHENARHRRGREAVDAVLARSAQTRADDLARRRARLKLRIAVHELEHPELRSTR